MALSPVLSVHNWGLWIWQSQSLLTDLWSCPSWWHNLRPPHTVRSSFSVSLRKQKTGLVWKNTGPLKSNGASVTWKSGEAYSILNKKRYRLYICRTLAKILQNIQELNKTETKKRRRRKTNAISSEYRLSTAGYSMTFILYLSQTLGI